MKPEAASSQPPIRVLYLHMVGAFGGASRSLFEIINAMPKGAIDARFVTPRGSVVGFFGKLGQVIEARGLSKFDNTRYSYYRGFRWIVLLREVLLVPSTLRAIYRAFRAAGPVDLIHVNEFIGVLPWLWARYLFKAPVIVHVRSVARDDPHSLRTRFVNWLFRTRADAVVAIDETVRASLPADIAVDVIHNAFAPKPPGPDDDDFERKLSLRPGSFKVGFVGNLLRVKGIHELVEAARLTRDDGLDIEYIIVGGDADSSSGLKAQILNALGIGQNVGSDVHAAITRLGLRDRMHMVGFTPDISRIYRCMDVLCFPSHFDAPGRPIFEAAFMKVPSIVALRSPKPDTLVDGVSGIAISPQDANELAAAIALMARDQDLTRRMGEAAYHMALNNFNAERNSVELLTVYKRVLASRS